MGKRCVLCLIALSSSVQMSSALEMCADPSQGDPVGLMSLGPASMPCAQGEAMVLGTFTSQEAFDSGPDGICATVPPVFAGMGRTETYAVVLATTAPGCCRGGLSACDPRRWNAPKADGKRGTPTAMCWPPEAAAPDGTTFTVGEDEVLCSQALTFFENEGQGWQATRETCAKELSSMPISAATALAVMEATCCPYCTSACHPDVLDGKDMSDFLPTCAVAKKETTAAPTTAAPTTAAPTTAAPTTAAPTTSAPTTVPPATAAPAPPLAVEEPAAVTQVPPPEDEAGSAWRQAMPSCMAITALLWASSN